MFVGMLGVQQSQSCRISHRMLRSGGVHVSYCVDVRRGKWLVEVVLGAFLVQLVLHCAFSTHSHKHPKPSPNIIVSTSALRLIALPGASQGLVCALKSRPTVWISAQLATNQYTLQLPMFNHFVLRHIPPLLFASIWIIGGQMAFTSGPKAALVA